MNFTSNIPLLVFFTELVFDHEVIDTFVGFKILSRDLPRFTGVIDLENVCENPVSKNGAIHCSNAETILEGAWSKRLIWKEKG